MDWPVNIIEFTKQMLVLLNIWVTYKQQINAAVIRFILNAHFIHVTLLHKRNVALSTDMSVRLYKILHVVIESTSKRVASNE